MANKDLKAWLGADKRDYQEGVNLLKACKVKVKNEKFFFTEEPTLIHRNMLHKTLLNFDRVHNQISDAEKKESEEKKKAKKNQGNASKNLADIRLKLDVVDKEITNGRVVIDKNPRVKYEDLPENLQKAYDENGKKYGEIKTVHAKIKALSAEAKNDKARFDLMNIILDVQKEVKENWKLIDDWAAAKPNAGDDKEDPVKPSGAFTKEQIEELKDPAIQALSKDLRIDANVAYIRRFAADESKKDKVDFRIAELKAWEIDYEARIGKN